VVAGNSEGSRNSVVALRGILRSEFGGVFDPTAGESYWPAGQRSSAMLNDALVDGICFAAFSIVA
jgi:hypothetical protein